MHFGIDYSLLEQYYMQMSGQTTKQDKDIFFLSFNRLVDIVNSTGKGYNVWQDIIDHHVKVKIDTVVEVWKVSDYSNHFIQNCHQIFRNHLVLN
jgi:hypothetical protein